MKGILFKKKKQSSFKNLVATRKISEKGITNKVLKE